jgi:bacterioferritin (cytochrome b1)
VTEHKNIEDLLKDNNSTESVNTEASSQESNDLSIETIDNKSESQDVTVYTSETVIELLKKSLNIHWQQTTVLSAQAIHLDRWGYKKLADAIKKDAIEEHRHAMMNLERLEFFDIDYQPLIINPPSWTRHDITAIINYNLASVREASSAERATIVAARSVGDELTANIMIPLLQGSEDGIKLYEGYLKLIEQMGLDNFLSLQA